MTVIQYRGRYRATGKEVAMNLHHFFQLRDGKPQVLIDLDDGKG